MCSGAQRKLRTSENSVTKLSEKGFERRSECGLGRYIGAERGRIVPLRCPGRPRFAHLRDFSDSFTALDFSHLAVCYTAYVSHPTKPCGTFCGSVSHCDPQKVSLDTWGRVSDAFEEKLHRGS